MNKKYCEELAELTNAKKAFAGNERKNKKVF
jgi:hypothetical protein